MAKYTVVTRGISGARDECQVEAQNVHIEASGHIKFLDGKGKDAELVAFFNASDVVSVKAVK